MKIAYRDRHDAGSCNFCTDNHHKKVFEFSGEHNGCLTVRMCNLCLDKLVDYSGRKFSLMKIPPFNYITKWESDGGYPKGYVRKTITGKIVARVTRHISVWHTPHEAPFVGIEVWVKEPGNGQVYRDTSDFNQDKASLCMKGAMDKADKFIDKNTEWIKQEDFEDGNEG